MRQSTLIDTRFSMQSVATQINFTSFLFMVFQLLSLIYFLLEISARNFILSATVSCLSLLNEDPK
jgi:hypothetical protein